MAIASPAAAAPPAAAPPKPNVVLIVVDNFGYGDLGCYGSTKHRTPHVDRLAREGRKFTSFYVTSGVCSPSRASIMTGCYPRRVNLHASGDNTAVLRPLDTKGLHPHEVTLAEVFKSAGYATACVGKWHLGDQPEFLPTRQGFDEYFGIPYSDDMTRDKMPDRWPELPLMRGERVVEAPVDRDGLTQRYTREAIRLLTEHRDRPFFLYLPHAMPGSTAQPFSSAAFRGKSANGDYGDSVEELDWSTGEILAALDKLDLARRTLVIWTSDNGAVQRNPTQGSNAPLRGWGYDTSEGAMRMPCLMRWPGIIPAGTECDELCSTLDLLPTFAALAGVEPSAVSSGTPLRGGTHVAERRATLDGYDIRPLLLGADGAKSPYDEGGFFYYRLEQLQAVRAGPWKLYLPLEKKFVSNGRKTAPSKLELYDVRRDLSETREVSAENPAVVKRLLALAERARVELGDVDRPGAGQRPAGRVDNPRPQRLAD